MSKDLINHVVFLLDASGSMAGRETAVMSVLKQQVNWLVERGDQFDQENRVTIYTFDSGNYNGLRLKCPVFDMDVKRLRDRLKNNALGNFYTPVGGTPLIDATKQGIRELGQTCQLYGDTPSCSSP